MKNILVFPCGSEIALEIYRSICFSTHFKLFGASSVDDHGKFIYENYIGDIPFHNHKDFIPVMQDILKKYNIDAIYPAMDLVAYTLKKSENKLGCKVIGSSLKTTHICSSKALTYKALEDSIYLPKIYKNIESAIYPMFIKPMVGYGSRNTYLASSISEANTFLEKHVHVGEFLLCENLPYEEYTIDCFSNKDGKLLYTQARQRARISNGISVNTHHVKNHKAVFDLVANEINTILKPRGAWFFQMKEDSNKEPKLLEIASRLGGSSSLCRAKGVNFAMLSLFDAFDINVEILENKYDVELDRALSNRYKINLEYKNVYIDFDDCIIVNNSVNIQAISFIYKSIKDGKKVILLTRHDGDIEASLKAYRLQNVFDEIIHIDKKEKKSSYITEEDTIFIDDSHQERKDVFLKKNIPVFSPDMIEVLL
jgi:hypothetical protein